MAGIGSGGRPLLPGVSECELADWLGRVCEAICTTPYGEVKLILAEGRLVELVITSKYRPPACKRAQEK